jgi:hypothetical protein
MFTFNYAIYPKWHNMKKSHPELGSYMVLIALSTTGL